MILNIHYIGMRTWRYITCGSPFHTLLSLQMFHLWSSQRSSDIIWVKHGIEKQTGGLQSTAQTYTVEFGQYTTVNAGHTEKGKCAESKKQCDIVMVCRNDLGKQEEHPQSRQQLCKKISQPTEGKEKRSNSEETSHVFWKGSP